MIVCIGFRMAGNDKSGSFDDSSVFTIYGVCDAQITGGLEGTGRESAAYADEAAGRFMDLQMKKKKKKGKNGVSWERTVKRQASFKGDE